MTIRSMRSVRVAKIAIVLCILALGCRRADHRIGGNGSPIILISVDTLRSDHLPAYGYAKIETPAMDALRADSILYERAYSQCPLTLVSHATMFTGLLPAEHGVRDNAGYELRKDVKTLPELLKGKGYATGAAVSTIVLRGETGVKRGFDFYDDDIDIDPNFLSMGRAQRKGDETREIAQRWIAEHKAQPFFFFFHIYEPHTPYEPTYDADIATADAVVGRFLNFLRDQGIYDRATIVFLSDHGEGEHGILLYREALQVPLMVKLPGAGDHGETVNTPVQLTDIYPTIAEPLELPKQGEGSSLLAALHGKVDQKRLIYSETYYPRFHFGWSDLHSMISAANHYIQGPKPELFDLAADPAEKVNVLQENRRTYLAMREAIAPYVKGAEAPRAIDPERAKQLAALGYVGSTASTSPQAELPDPKDHIGSSGDIKKGFLAFQEKRYEDAIAIFERLLRENPNMLDIWSMRANSLAKLGRYDEAIDAAKQGLRLAPTSAPLAVLIAHASLETKRLDDAEKHAKLVENDAPIGAHSLLAQVYLLRKDYARSTAETKAILSGKRDRPFALMLLGRIAMDQGKPEEGLRHFDEALAFVQSKQRQAIHGLHFFRGDAFARMGQGEEAEREFRKEIELYPTAPQAYKNLILLYATEGKNDAATQLIFSLEKAAPTPPSYIAISETLKIVGDRNGSRFWAARGLNRFPKDRQLQALLRG